MDKIFSHHYLHDGFQYENQKEACLALGITVRAFRFKVNAGEIKFIKNNSQNRHYEKRKIQDQQR